MAEEMTKITSGTLIAAEKVEGTDVYNLQGEKLGLAYDYEAVSHQPISSSGYANAVGVYATYQATEKMSFNTRGEWFTQSKSNAGPGYPSKVFALTETIQYDLWKNVLSRVEFRWDHSGDGSPAYGNNNANGTPTLKNSYELIANIIYKF